MAGSTLDVRRAKTEDVAWITSVLQTAAQWLLSKGIDMWERRDFSNERTSAQVSRGEYWIGTVDGDEVGVFRVLWEDPRLWEDSPADAGYIHNLAVASGFHGQGIGGLLLGGAEARIAQEGYALARLDCMLGNEQLRTFYTDAGYRLVGERLEERYNAWLFEKKLGR